MPLFEFVCSECSQPFEELVRSTSSLSEVSCPACGSQDISKKISTFASRATGGGAYSFNTGASSASCNAGSA